MRIEFDPTNRDEATAVRAVLAALHGAEPVTITKREASPLVLTDEEITETIGLEPDETYSGEPVTDANNEPHDPRIHSTPAKTNADGTWRAKRGVTAEQVAAVKAEREATTQAIDPRELEANGVHPEDMNDPVYEYRADENETVEETAPASLAPTPPAPPSAPPAPATDPIEQFAAEVLSADAPVSFLDVMKAITAAQKDGKIDTAKVKELCAAVGAGESTMGLNGPDNGDKRGQFMALLASETEGK